MDFIVSWHDGIYRTIGFSLRNPYAGGWLVNVTDLEFSYKTLIGMTSTVKPVLSGH